MTFRPRMLARSAAALATAAIATAAVGIGSCAICAAEPTDAAFTDAEHVSSGTVTALDIPEPISSRFPGCVTDPGLLGIGPTVTIYWRAPAGSGYALADAEFAVESQPGLLDPLLPGSPDVSTSGSAEAYTTVISKGLLNDILGGSVTIGIRFIGPGGWTSDWLTATGSMSLAGLDRRCVMGTAPSS